MTHDWLDQLIGEWTFHSVSVPPDPQYDRTGSETVTRRGAWIVIEPIEDASEADSRVQLAFNPETGTTSQGATLDEALANLREAVELFLEEFPMRLGPPPLVTTLSVAEHA